MAAPAPPPPPPAVPVVPQPNVNQALNNQNALLQGGRIREKVKQHAKTVGECDGTNRRALREWIQAVDRTKVWTEAPDNAIVEMVASLMTGPLATHLTMVKEAAVANQGPLTWDMIKAEAKRQFLEIDEDESLRENVDNMVQGAHEETQSYVQRYQQALRVAYTAQDLAVPLVRDRIIRNFIKGIRNFEVRKQVHLARPGTLDQVFHEVMTAQRAVELANQGGPLIPDRVEEPMEIGASGPWDRDRDGRQEMKDILKRLQERFDTLEQKVTQATTSARSAGPRPSGSRPKRGKNPNIVCHECRGVGHIKRDCPSRNRGTAATKAPVPSGTMEQRIAALEVAISEGEKN